MLNILLDTLFPERCLGCRNPGTALCQTCISKIPPAENTEPFVFSLYQYGHPLVQKTIHDFKYKHKGSAARRLMESGHAHILEYISDMLQGNTPQALYLVPIPQHTSKTLLRGFNQSKKLAQWAKTILPGSVMQEVLKKHTKTVPQARIQNKIEREENITHTMRATKDIDKDALYIVFDDVTTTGATFKEAKRALRAGGATSMLCIALAHGYK
jgi:predicted amidophosphoribosyltransferase